MTADTSGPTTPGATSGPADAPPTFCEPRLLVDGVLTEARSGSTFDNVDPATEKVLGVCADAGAEDVDAAVAAARRAFDETAWATDPAFRSRCLRQLQEALDAHRAELHDLLVAEAGCPVALLGLQVDNPVADLSFWVDLAASYDYERAMPEREVFGAPQRRLLRREPSGVVGAITPWNFPLNLNLAKLGPALAAGNTVVLKPAPDTPWSATVLGRIAAEETDIPAGVLNVVASSDHLVGEALVADPRVDMITFTGSTATGRRILAVAAPTVKKVFLELGGKSANIVLDDADLSSAVATSSFGVCTHAGQGCAIATRLLVPRSRYDEAVEVALGGLSMAPYGDPRDPATLAGPLVSARQRQRVLGYIETGRREGSPLLHGGGVPAHLSTGFYVEPTLFGDTAPSATIAQEEIFGPVLCVICFEDDDDAVRIANDSIYGLSGAVSSASEERALAVARRIRTGTLMVNGGMWNSPDVPFGGYRQSGLGREGGIQGFEEYLETKVMALPGTVSG